jgi:hypothetical protein
VTVKHFEAVFDKETGRLFALTDPAAPTDGTLVTCPATANLHDPGPCICGAEPEHYSKEWIERDDERASVRGEGFDAEEASWTLDQAEKGKQS